MRRFAALLLLLCVIPFVVGGCSTTFPRRNPTGEAFPSVRGTSLEGAEVALPEVGKGAPLLLLIGYEQNTQFDLDRWLLGLSGVVAWFYDRGYSVGALRALQQRLAELTR